MRSEIGRWTDMVLAASPSLGHARDSVESELLAMSTLIALERYDLIPRQAAFVGGTALRLCHGSPRMSVDLDFHLPFDAPAWQLDRESLARHIEDVIGAPVEVSTPTSPKSRFARVSAILPERTRALKRPATKIDAGRGVLLDVSSTTVFLRMAGTPPGASDIHSPFAVMASSRQEILVDKHLALAGRQRRIKQRDVFDILWLRQVGTSFDADMMAAKLDGFGMDKSAFLKVLDTQAKQACHDVESGEYESEMSKFLP